MELKELEGNISKEIIDFYIESGVRELYPPQKDAIGSGVLKGENLIVAIPTASGKTLIAELTMLKSLEKGGKALYIVPLRALASEKYRRFKEFEKFGIRVGISTGDYESNDERLGDYDILVATSEKVDSLIRNGVGWIEELSVVVIDEIHLINSADRGPTLEITISRFRRMNQNIQILGLSATIGNAHEIADWLGAKLVLSDWRPVDLFDGVYLNDTIYFDKGAFEDKRVINGRTKDPTLSLVGDAIEEGGQCLVFANTRRNSQLYAKKISKFLGNHLKNDGKREEAAKIISEIDDTEFSSLLAQTVRSGVAFHHAGLSNEHRRVIEENFKDGTLRVLTCTPTLAAGVNLPARRVIITSYRRYTSNYGLQPIPVLDYKQMSGRAGRPGLDPYGEAIAISKSEQEQEYLFENYIRAEPENMWSKLGTENALRSHVLSTIVGFAKNFEELLEFFSTTFFAHQQDLWRIEDLLRGVLQFLEEKEFIYTIEVATNQRFLSNSVEFKRAEEYLNKEYALSPTELGKLVSRLYIDPLSASMMIEGLEKTRNFEGDLTFLHIVCLTPDMKTIYLRKGEDLILSNLLNSNEKLFHHLDGLAVDDWILSSLKTALLLRDWIEERAEKEICGKYNIGPGDLYNRVETSEWLLRSMSSIAGYLKISYSAKIKDLSMRIRDGIKEELLGLVSLSSVGRVRARALYNAGYRSLEDLRTAKIKELSNIKGIDVKIASSILRQLNGEIEDQ